MSARGGDLQGDGRPASAEGNALNNLGLALRKVRRFEEAITACEDAAAVYRRTGDRHWEGMTLNNRGVMLRQVGRFEEAITAHQDAAAIYRETGDRQREGRALNNMEIAQAAQEVCNPYASSEVDEMAEHEC